MALSTTASTSRPAGLAVLWASSSAWNLARCSVMSGASPRGPWSGWAARSTIKEPPQSDVEVGIDRVFAAHSRDEILVFDDLRGYLDEKLSYSRELDERGEPH